MNSPASAPSSKRFPVRAMYLAGAVATALTYNFIRGGKDTAPETPVAAAATTDMLAALPPLSSTDGAGKARAAAVAKIHSAPASAAAWVDLGDVLAQELRDTANQTFYDHAETAYREALRLAPAKPEAMTGLAWVFGGRHQFNQSIEWANKALAARADIPEACGIIGDAGVELGHYDDALDHYQKMMDLRPDLSSWSRGAHLLWITGNKSKAIWLMERAIKAGAPYAENTAWCRARLAMMLFNDGALLPAAQVLEPALAAGTRNTGVLLAAGRIAAARDEMEAAKKHYQTILEGGPNHEALAALGDIASAAGKAAEAEKFYVEVESLHASHAATGVHDHMAMAKFFADHDRNLIEALRLAEQAKLTKNVQEADTLAWVYLKNGDTASAIAAMKRALSRNTPDAELRYHAGMIAAAAGDRVSAQKHLQAALSFNPRFSILQAPLAEKTLDSLGTPATSAVDQAFHPDSAMRFLFLLCLTLLTARTIHAHDEPTSYVDLRPAADGLTITVLASTTDLAHYLPEVEPAMLLQPAVLAAQRAALHLLITSRLRCSGLTLESPAFVPVPDKRDIRMEFKAVWPREPAQLTVECQLFPYDPRHRTFLTVHRGDAVERTEIFQDSITRMVIPLGTSQSTFQVIREFFAQGIHHIFIGPDHILFVVGLLLLGGSMGRLLKIVTAFTVAHSITLGLATFNILTPPAAIIEPVIALSIVFVGVHAALPGRKRDPRLVFAFTFGLIHGFGFAFALQDLSLPRAALGWSLFSFNGGVEAGQACIVLLVAPLFSLLRRRDPRLSGHIVTAAAACVALAGLFWFVERVMA